jgi:hypothetical protein
MRRMVRVNFITRPAVYEYGNLIAHRTGGQENSSFLTKHLRDLLAEPVDGRVTPMLLIPDFRSCHCLTHPRAGPGLRVAVKIDGTFLHGSSLIVVDFTMKFSRSVARVNQEGAKDNKKENPGNITPTGSEWLVE